MRRRLLPVVVAAAVAAGTAGAALYDRGGGPSTARAGACRQWVAGHAYRREIRAVRGLVPRMKRALAAPGLSIAVAADGKLVWSESCGFADVRRRRPVTRKTQFRIGSLSKPLTAATIARLARQGRLNVDREITDYVPEFPRSRAPVPTLRQLGGHLGGIRHYEGGEAINIHHYTSISDSLRVFIDDPLISKPGAEFHYSSYGFNLLGAAIERAGGSNFATVVGAMVLRPLGLKATSVGRSLGAGTRFYEVTGDRRARLAPRIDLSDRYPSGGFLSTADDLVRFGIGVTDPGFLDADSRGLLLTSQKLPGGGLTGYGFGFEVGESPVGPVAGHTGNVVGGTAFLLLHPRTRVVIALTTNIGFVTAQSPPDLSEAPQPPQMAMPFIRHVLDARR
jgi:serine beta-lactamase-like protein LACTB